MGESGLAWGTLYTHPQRTSFIIVEVSNVNIDDKKVELKGHGSEFIDYDYLVLASGSCPRKLNVPGHDLNNIFTLRTTIDANKIADNVKSKKVVVVGSSFIGTEVSAFLSDKGKMFLNKPVKDLCL